jgi:glucose/arabinose dehydrogenase
VTVASVHDVATGLDVPWGLARLPDGSHLVSLRDEARVVHIGVDGTVTPVRATGPDGRVPGVHPDGEGGLLGLAVASGDPATVYAYLTAADDNRVVRMSYHGGRLGPLRLVVAGIPKSGVHNGGRLAFGPDGMLYIATGDGSDGGRAQDRHSLAGKILRVTPDGRPASGNPFPGSPVWSLGHRNVQGLGWDSQGRMFASEFGQNTWDELNRIEPGHNYGWPDVEGRGSAADVQRGLTNPLVVWRTDEASPSGIAVGRGAVWLAALRGERLWRVPLRQDGSVGTPQALLQDRLGRLRSVEIEPDGSLLLLTGNTFRGQPRPGDDRLVRATLTQ